MEKTIVVAEDSRTMREAIRRVLEPEGYQLLFASGGADGLKLARQATPNLVLADSSLAGGDAAWLIGQLKGEAALSSVPVVVLHGPKETVSEKDRIRLGAVDSLGKPFSASELLETVMRALHRPKAAKPKARLTTLEDRIARMEQVLGGSPSAAPAKKAPASDEAAVLDALRQAGRTFQRAAGRSAAAPAKAAQPPAARAEPAQRPDAYVPRAAAKPPAAKPAKPAQPAPAPPTPRPEQAAPQAETQPIPAAAAPAAVAAPGQVIDREALLEAVRQVAREAVERAIWDMVPDLAEKILWEVVPGVVESLAREHVLDQDKE